MSVSTHIEGLSIHELLGIVSNSRLSGVMTVIDRWKAGRLVFVWGRVVHASADGQARLGELLIRKGVLSAKQLEEALEAQRTHKKPRPLGTLITAMGYAQSGRVESTVREQMKGAFFEIMKWQEGIVHFQLDQASCASLMVDVGLDCHTLLLEAARRDDESGQFELVEDDSELDESLAPASEPEPDTEPTSQEPQLVSDSPGD